MPKRNYPGNAGSSRGFNGMMKDDEIHGNDNSYDFGARIFDARVGRWLSIDPMEQEFPQWSPYHFSLDNPVQFFDPDGESPISALVKYLVKKGVKEGLKKFTEKQIKGRLQNYMTKGMGKQLSKDLDDILTGLDSEWWEIGIELIPVAGDIYGATKFGKKLTEAYGKLQDLENKYVQKVYDQLVGKAKERFKANMRRAGVRAGRRDQKVGIDNGVEYTGDGTVHGDHIVPVKEDPSKMTDPRNIHFKTDLDHRKRHSDGAAKERKAKPKKNKTVSMSF